jgi:hypothetical protein
MYQRICSAAEDEGTLGITGPLEQWDIPEDLRDVLCPKHPDSPSLVASGYQDVKVVILVYSVNVESVYIHGVMLNYAQKQLHLFMIKLLARI